MLQATVGDVSLPILFEGDPRKVLVILGHGAGGHAEHPTMSRLAGLVASLELAVARFNFPYRAQGRKIPDPMDRLTVAYQCVIEIVRDQFQPKVLIIGGHSMGGRVASVLQSQVRTADGLVLFGYPLHPPGRPDKRRDSHLARIDVPVLQMNGTRDAFCTKERMNDVVGELDGVDWTLHWIDGADHSYNVLRSSGRNAQEVDEEMRLALAEWLAKHGWQ